MSYSPNVSSRNGALPSLLVLHYTGMRSAEEAVERLCDPIAKVSAHYVVEENGTVHTLAKETHCAWHAGVSFWRGVRNVNETSIGIEIVNPGHEWGYRPFPQVQMEALAQLCRGIIARHAIAPRNVVGHSDVAPQRKSDPGELFDWAWLAAQGVGLWPFAEEGMHPHDIQALREGEVGDDVLWMQTSLASYGYSVPLTGSFDRLTHNVAVAFQRHFRPFDISGVWDAECALRLEALLQANNAGNYAITRPY